MAFATRRIALPGGRTLVVRPVVLNDVDGLAELYHGLTETDLYCRFFSAYHPDRRFLERVATAADRGGFGLVAVVPGDRPEGGRIVAEAGYQPLANRGGELAITVAADWRGWLGSYLLDAVVDAAADRGVPNLEGDILAVNRRMLALVRARGCAVMDGPDWTVTRVIVGTRGPTPTWPGRHDRLQVLVETPGGRWHAAAAAYEAGVQVLGCPGPLVHPARCPALAGVPCPLAAQADVIILSRQHDDEQLRVLLDAHRRLHPGVPVGVELCPGDRLDAADAVSVPGADDKAVVAFVDGLARRRASH